MSSSAEVANIPDDILPEPKPAADTALDELKRRMEEMQAQIAKLAEKK